MDADAPSSRQRAFPDEFAHLEPWADWAMAGQTQRAARRESSSLRELEELYQAVGPHLETILDHLDQNPFPPASDEDVALLCLTFSFVEAAAAIELYDRPAVTKAYPASRFDFEVLRP